MQLVQRLERFENSFIGVSEVQLVLAVVLKEERVGPGEDIFVDLVESQAAGQGQRAAHQHGRAVADESGDRRIGQWAQVEFLERRIHAVAKILRRVDQRAVEIEDEQLQPLHGNRAKNMDHVFSLKGAAHCELQDARIL